MGGCVGFGEGVPRAHFPLPWKARLQAEESVRKFPLILDPTEGPRKMYILPSLRGRSLLNSEPDSFPGERERKRHGVPAAGCLVSDPSGIHCFFPGPRLHRKKPVPGFPRCVSVSPPLDLALRALGKRSSAGPGVRACPQPRRCTGGVFAIAPSPFPVVWAQILGGWGLGR